MPAENRGSYYDENGEYHIVDYDPDVIIKEDKSQRSKGKKDQYVDINDEELKPPAPPVW